MEHTSKTHTSVILGVCVCDPEKGVIGIFKNASTLFKKLRSSFTHLYKPSALRPRLSDWHRCGSSDVIFQPSACFPRSGDSSDSRIIRWYGGEMLILLFFSTNGETEFFFFRAASAFQQTSFGNGPRRQDSALFSRHVQNRGPQLRSQSICAELDEITSSRHGSRPRRHRRLEPAESV